MENNNLKKRRLQKTEMSYNGHGGLTATYHGVKEFQNSLGVADTTAARGHRNTGQILTTQIAKGGAVGRTAALPPRPVLKHTTALTFHPLVHTHVSDEYTQMTRTHSRYNNNNNNNNKKERYHICISVKIIGKNQCETKQGTNIIMG